MKQTLTFNAKGVEFNLVLVHGGTLELGGTREHQNLGYTPEDEKVHTVTMDDYYIGETVVTQALWEAVMGWNRSEPSGPELPIDLVSWDECQEFTQKLNALTGHTFRLPTEAEWEYAARGAYLYEDWWLFPGTDYLPNIAPVVEGYNDDLQNLLRVKQHRPNALGIYDMSGLVFQWCNDWYASDYPSEPTVNPQGPKTGEMRVIRGGCWSCVNNDIQSLAFCRTASRHQDYPEYGHPGLGLRLAISAADAERGNYKTPCIVVYGEALVDRINQKEAIGGAAFNAALDCKQLTKGDVGIISAVGHDYWGDRIMCQSNRDGLKNLISQRRDYLTGEVIATVDKKGNPTYNIKTGVAYDNIPITERAETMAKEASFFIWGTLANRNATGSRTTLMHLMSLLPQEATRVFDINLRPTFDDDLFLVWCLEHTDVLKLNQDELLVLNQKFGVEGTKHEEEQCRNLMNAFHIGMVVLTLGENGSYIFTTSETSYLETPTVTVKDTIGCGDSFCAAIVIALSKGLSLEKMHHLAVEVSAYTATQSGGQPHFSPEIRNLFLSC
jgi:fructokinase